MKCMSALAFAFIAIVVTVPARAEVTQIEISSRTDVLGGRSYGVVGPYEWLQGRAHFALDPAHPRNRNVVDLGLAPRNSRGLVEFSADIAIMRPKDSARASGVTVFDVANRGRPIILDLLDRGNFLAKPGNTPEYIGDDFLMKQGTTLVWLGWQHDLPAQPGLLRMAAPQVMGIKGLVNGDEVVAARTTDISLGDRTSIPYPVTDPNAVENTLTVADSRSAPQRIVPRSEWSFARIQNGELVGDPRRIYLKNGFEPGAYYRFVYRTSDPYVVGVGLAAVRDLMSWMRHDPAAIIHAKYTYAFGASQSGRFLRQFLNEGFNADLAGRTVFDGMMVHIAGGSRRGSNERFAQPSRSLVSRVFPFSDIEQTDPDTGEHGGLLDKASEANAAPKIIYTHSSWEYWGSAASAMHTTIDGKGDVRIPDTSRVYFFAGTQHVPAAFPPRAAAGQTGQLLPNPIDYRPALRALYVALDRWVREGTLPPPSRYPMLADGSLVDRQQINMKGLAGISIPNSPQRPVRLDLGEETYGVQTIVPARAGKPYPVLVPQLDDDGNETAGIRMPELAVPLGTHTGWNLRSPSIGAPTDLIQLVGSYHPFARTATDRASTNDPRRSIEERYPSRQHYLGLVAESAQSMVEQRLMMPEDAVHVLSSAKQHWNFLMEKSAMRPQPVVGDSPAVPR
jgi:hypothetical protein